MNKKLKKQYLKMKEDIENGNYESAYVAITSAMKDNPDSGVPHNFLGILEERQRNHIGAMKHFRAAWALEPTLLPARWNLDVYGTGRETVKCAFLDEDVPDEEKKPKYICIYDERGIGHMVRRELC